jgi:hypothetical protein
MLDMVSNIFDMPKDMGNDLAANEGRIEKRDMFAGMPEARRS